MGDGENKARLRRLPSVDRLSRDPRVVELASAFGHEAATEATRWALEQAREMILSGGQEQTIGDIIAAAVGLARALWGPSLVRTVNATGVIIHTNLGRTPLSVEALAAVETVARGYSNLEYDLKAGERGSRQVHASTLLARLTGAEAAMVVNNNASAVLLALTALAQGGEVVVSRGQAVEIGGGFRIPDVLRQSGARLVEVGTTNRTYTADYERAIGPQTALLLRVHSSNFRVVGFVHDVSVAELASLGRRRGLPVLDDIGSGALLETADYGLAHEPMPQESVAAGAAVVCFSGDKLLGGPQAGLIVGKNEYVERLRRHPLARAVRIDKLTLAALQATLLHYARGEAQSKVPVWQMIATDESELERRVERWREALRSTGIGGSVAVSEATVGGGSLPGETIRSRALALTEQELAAVGLSVEQTLARLRAGHPPVVARAARGALLLDARTVLPGEDEELLSALRVALQKK